jgi:NADPH-dependent 2,4-dienoyl-CoA reductase/sulfur reductase-like enzyme
LHTDVGTPHSEHLICPPMDVDPGFSVHLAAEIKKAVSIPVIAAGRINDISLAAQIIQKGHADLVTMGRALLADPDLPVKSQQGRFDDICHCIACNQGCRGAVTSGEPVVCFQNPMTGREGTLNYDQVSDSDRKTVLIAGAGPAGLEAACVLAEKGHLVKLYEKKSEPGGAFLLASKPPYKSVVYEAIRYRMQCLQNMDMEINFNQEVDVSIIEDVRPDIVIIATGSVPMYPAFPMKADAIYSPDDVFSGKMPEGNHVLILGGGIVGCETADYLADKGYHIHLVEQLNEVATGYHKSRRFYLLERLKKNNVQFILGTRTLEVDLPRVRLEINGREEVHGDYDSVIYAIGRRANDKLKSSLKQCALPIEMFTIGDASSPRSALEAIQEAAIVSAAI